MHNGFRIIILRQYLKKRAYASDDVMNVFSTTTLTEALNNSGFSPKLLLIQE